MGLSIDLEGVCGLHETYQTKGKSTYYIALTATAKSQVEGIPSTQFQLTMPLTQEQYANLRKDLENSKAERPIVLAIEKLELSIGSVCIN